MTRNPDATCANCLYWDKAEPWDSIADRVLRVVQSGVGRCLMVPPVNRSRIMETSDSTYTSAADVCGHHPDFWLRDATEGFGQVLETVYPVIRVSKETT